MWAGHNDDCNSYYSVYSGSSWSSAQSFDWSPYGCPTSTARRITYANMWYLDDTIHSYVRSIETSPNYLDLYLLHWTSSHPFGETLAGFEKLQKDGKIRAYGVSNFDVDDLEEARPLAGNAIACNQVAYHLKERYIERRVLPWCKEHGIAIVAYSPFGQGSFPRQGRGGAVLDQIARERGMTPRQMALAFLTRDPNVLAIPKSSKIKHIEENAAAGDLVLGPEEIAAIAEAFPLGADRGMPFL